MKNVVKKTSRLFLYIILAYVGIVVLFSALAENGIEIGTLPSLITSETTIILPGIIFLLFSKERITEIIPFKKIKPGTFFMLVLFSYLIMPIGAFVNALSLLVTDNILLESSKEILAYPLPVMLLIIGLFGPFCEEFIFRGIIFSGYKKSGRLLVAAVLSAVLFGLMHMNFNQFGYAMVLGFAFALTVEATGSIWASIIVHAVINSHNVIMMFLSERMTDAAGGLESMYADMDISTIIYPMIGVLLILSVIMGSLAACVLVWIAKHEGNGEHLHQIFSKQEKIELESTEENMEERPQFISLSLILSVLICVGIIIYTEIKL